MRCRLLACSRILARNQNLRFQSSGRGSSDSKCISPDTVWIANSPNPLQLTKNTTTPPTYTLTAPHTYAAPGTYYGTVSVTDQFGGAVSETFTITVRKTAQQVRFTSLPDRNYGDAPFAVTASGGPSGLPVTFAVSGDATVCSLSSPVIDRRGYHRGRHAPEGRAPVRLRRARRRAPTTRRRPPSGDPSIFVRSPPCHGLEREHDLRRDRARDYPELRPLRLL